MRYCLLRLSLRRHKGTRELARAEVTAWPLRSSLTPIALAPLAFSVSYCPRPCPGTARAIPSRRPCPSSSHRPHPRSRIACTLVIASPAPLSSHRPHPRPRIVIGLIGHRGHLVWLCSRLVSLCLVSLCLVSSRITRITRTPPSPYTTPPRFVLPAITSRITLISCRVALPSLCIALVWVFSRVALLLQRSRLASSGS